MSCDQDLNAKMGVRVVYLQPHMSHMTWWVGAQGGGDHREGDLDSSTSFPPESHLTSVFQNSLPLREWAERPQRLKIPSGQGWWEVWILEGRSRINEKKHDSSPGRR